YLSSVEFEGLTYPVSDIETISNLLKALQPKKALIPSAFQTSINKIKFSNVALNINVNEKTPLRQPISGLFKINEVEVWPGKNRVDFDGNLSFENFKTSNSAGYSGNIHITKGF